MRKFEIKKKKALFLQELQKSRGLITTACVNTGVTRQTIFHWRKDDEEFNDNVEVVLELQGDRVESNLQKLIDEGDTQSTIFYCKTKLKNRGYGDSVQTDSAKESSEENHVNNTHASPSVQSKIDYLIGLMSECGKYVGEFTVQIEVVARSLVELDKLEAIANAPDYQPILTEYSREGNPRQIVNPLQAEIRACRTQVQTGLKALGLNADAKPIKSDDGGLADFINDFKPE